MTTWYAGGPDDFETRYPDSYYSLPSFMQTCLDVVDPPLTPVAMSITCAALMVVPYWGQANAYWFGLYQEYYGQAYRASPPGTYTGTPHKPTIPVDYSSTDMPSNDLWDYTKVQSDRMYQFLQDWGTFKAQWEYFYYNAAFSGDTTPLPAATSTDTSRLLAAIFAVANAIAKVPTEKDTNRILGAIFAVAHGQAANVEPDLTEIFNRFDTVDASLASVLAGETDILDAIAALEPGGTSEGVKAYPGATAVTFGTTVEVTSEGTLSAVTHGVGGKMDGVAISVTSVPARVTVRTAEGTSNYRYAGWLTFADADGRCEDPQYVNLGSRVYVPRAMRDPAYCICAFTHLVVANVTPWAID